MEIGITREAALALLKQYNKEPFHLRHALTVEAVMDWYAARLDPENREFCAKAGGDVCHGRFLPAEFQTDTGQIPGILRKMCGRHPPLVFPSGT